MHNDSERRTASQRLAVISIFGLLSCVLFARGLYTLFTGHYLGTTRLGLRVDLHDMPAFMMGGGYLCLGAGIGFAIFIERSNGRLFKWLTALSLLMGAGCFVAALLFPF